MRIESNKKIVVQVVIAFLSLWFAGNVAGQEEEMDSQLQRAASIEKMRERIAEIEKDLKRSTADHAQGLGEEAFELINQIEQTYLQIEDAYQRQVVELNTRMRQMWQQLENAEDSDRAAVDKKLEMLQSEWDRVYLRLTETHDAHLKQLRGGIAKLRGELSTTAGQARARFEESRFESLNRWEKAHEIFLSLNQAFIKMIGDQPGILERPTGQAAMHERDGNLKRLRNRYLVLQERFQNRINSHLVHLDDELDVRQMQFAAANRWDARKRVQALLDDLGHRKHATFEKLQGSYRDTLAALQTASNEMAGDIDGRSGSQKANLQEQLVELQVEIAKTRKQAKATCLERAKFIEQQIVQLRSLLPELNNQERQQANARIDSLRATVRRLVTEAEKL